MIRHTDTLYVSDDDFVAAARLLTGRSIYIAKDGHNIMCDSFEEAKRHVVEYEKLMKEFWEIFK